MKASRRIFALVLALVMVISASITSFAAIEPQGKGSLTIENTLATREYKIYKVFDLTYKEGEGLPKYGNGEVTSPVTYKYFGSAANAAILDAGPFTTEQVAGTTDADGNSVYSVLRDDGVTDAAIIEFITAKAETLGTLERTVTADSDEFTETGLDYGYYYITTGNGSVVTIDSLIPNVTVVDKNEDIPSWDNIDDDENDPDAPDADEPGNGKVIIEGDSKVTENSVNYGETVKFSIAINAKALTKDAKTGEYGLATYYYIKDELGKGFTEPTDIKVNIYETDARRDYPDAPTKTLGSDEYRIVQDGNKFTIRIPFGLKFGSEAKIEVTYSATVKDTDAVTLGEEGNLNKASFLYDVDEEYDPNTPSDKHYNPDPDYDPLTNPDPDDPDPKLDYPDPEHPFGDEKDPSKNPDPDDVVDGENPRETKTYVYAIDVLKYTGDLASPTALEDARFTLQRKLPNTGFNSGQPESDSNPKYIYEKVPLAVDGDAAATTASYDYDKNGAGTYGTEGNPLTTKKDGKIVVKGLEEGTYVLTEIKAPEGYNLLTAPVEFILDKDSEDYKPTVTIKEAGAGAAQPAANSEAIHKDIENKSGVELPSTGGNGTGMFYLLGAILLAGGAVILNTKKRIGANR